MSETDHPKSHESWIEFFQRTKRFSDLILLSWHLVAFFTNQLVARQFGFYYTEERKKAAIMLKELTFEKKLSILRKLNAISKKDCAIVQKFQHYRNKLFHGEEPFYFLMSDDEKAAIAREAIDAINILQQIGFGTRYRMRGQEHEERKKRFTNRRRSS